MATNYLVLGQSAPSATTPTTLYTAPSATQAVASSIIVCNRGLSAATFRISIRPGGVSQADQHYIVYDASIAASDTVVLTIGVTLGTTDVVTVYASTADLSFSLFGSEVS